MILVQKFGGTSVGDPEKIRSAAERARRAREEGARVAVVVSAMGDTTDELLDLAYSIARSPGGRELDLLLHTGEVVSASLFALALQDMGVPAVALTGWQAGVKTDETFQAAHILAVEPERVRRALDEGVVPVVTGFQGVSSGGEVTTLGRGGSDLTAVALAAALGADRLEILSDVAGVYTADPRIVPEARKLKEISYEEMAELALLGAQVLQWRAVDHARAHGVVIHARSSRSPEEGTLVKGEVRVAGEVTGVAVDDKVARVCLIGVPDRPGVAYEVFEALAGDGINVDMIIQSATRNRVTDLCFTVAEKDVTAAGHTARRVGQALGAENVTYDTDVAKVSVVGLGMAEHPGVAARMFQALAEERINIQMISTSEIRISCLIERREAHRAVRAIHRAFALDREDAS
jgi:aspartate kinase